MMEPQEEPSPPGSHLSPSPTQTSSINFRSKSLHTRLVLTLVDATHDPVPDFARLILGAAVAAAGQAPPRVARAALAALVLQDRLVGLRGERLDVAGW